MARMPVLSGHELIKALRKAGFEPIRQRGSHVIMVKPGGTSTVVPLHKEIDKGTLLEILRQAKLKREEFVRLI